MFKILQRKSYFEWIFCKRILSCALFLVALRRVWWFGQFLASLLTLWGDEVVFPLLFLRKIKVLFGLFYGFFFGVMWIFMSWSHIMSGTCQTFVSVSHGFFRLCSFFVYYVHVGIQMCARIFDTGMLQNWQGKMQTY